MSDIGSWLDTHGLKKYAELFVENAVDVDVLSDITLEELKELGIPLGDRKRILKAIALEPNAAPVVGPSSARKTTLSSPGGEAERRQLTVMFCDLVGSTELSGQLDLESYRNVLSAYQDAARQAIAPYEGYIARYMGDGLLVYFGYPQAHEDDAERAVRAGLDIASSVQRLDVGNDLAVRIGIATGQVVAGDIVGEGASEERAVLGETPNLAARLQGEAEPNAVVIAESTKRLVDGKVSLDLLGTRALKGISGEVPIYRVRDVGTKASRFEAGHGGELAPLSGRESELALLLQRWRQATCGEGQVVFIEGEPGIGKSHLVQALREQLDGSEMVLQPYQCSPYYANTPFYPVINLIERVAGFRADDSTEAKLDRLQAVLTPSLAEERHAPALVASLLSLPVDQFDPIQMTSQQQREATIRVLVSELEAIASEHTVLVLFEDVHWCDPSTLDLIGSMIDRIQDLPVLFLLTHRPEFKPSWTGYGHTTSHSLNRLGRDAVSTVISAVAGGKGLPEEVIEQIVAKTDGVPLFVEELTKALLESGVLSDAGDEWQLERPLAPLAIPATLQDSLVSRLDRLATVKETAQMAACIGREFAYELLAAISPLPAEELQEALSQLVAQELVFRRGSIPNATYSFRHALVQDAARETLLPSRLRQIHLRLAETLPDVYPGIQQVQPELVAYHYAEAGKAKRAIELWLEAGRKARESSASREALAHLSKALELVPELPEAEDRFNQELVILTTLGPAQMVIYGYAASEVEQTYSRARELCRDVRETPQLYPTLNGLARFYLNRAELGTAQELAEQQLAWATDLNDARLISHAQASLGRIIYFRGDIQPALKHLQASNSPSLKYSPSHDTEFYVEDHRVGCLSTMAMALWHRGYPEQALLKSHEALELATLQSDVINQCYAMYFIALVHQFRREVESTKDQAERVLTLCREHGFVLYSARAGMLRGWALAESGHAEQGITEIEAGLSAQREIETVLGEPHRVALLAEAHARLGQFDHALEALASVKQTEEQRWDCELHRLRGELILRQDSERRVDSSQRPPVEAEASFRQALQLARDGGHRALELRAAMSLTRLLMGQHHRPAAYELLAPIYEWFSEGFETPDLREATELLDELR